MARWKAHFKSGPSEVYRALSTPLGRSRYWAESADERYQLRYFGRTIIFTLTSDESGGTDLTLSCDDPGGLYDADHVALLLRLKASVDFGVDLRNHDRSRSAHHADS